jgi:hypothetical protein
VAQGMKQAPSSVVDIAPSPAYTGQLVPKGKVDGG